eukprot:m.286320 g.286320  ORF g.286320 m.286320 type:complete len:141 (-) comp15780_c0_seq5:184-606(-)
MAEQRRPDTASRVRKAYGLVQEGSRLLDSDVSKAATRFTRAAEIFDLLAQDEQDLLTKACWEEAASEYRQLGQVADLAKLADSSGFSGVLASDSDPKAESEPIPAQAQAQAESEPESAAVVGRPPLSRMSLFEEPVPQLI